MITASVGVGSSLLLEPARELLFPLPASPDAKCRCCLTLTNLSPFNDVVFRVRTRNPDAFTVRPTHGLVAPGASTQVILTATTRTCERLSAMDPRDLVTRQSSELFLVQSVEREEEVQSLQPLDPDSNSSLRAFWKKVPRDCVTENKMVCRFTRPDTAPPLGYRTDENLLAQSAISTRSADPREFRSSRSASTSRLSRSYSGQASQEEARQERRSRAESYRTTNESFRTTNETFRTSRASFRTTNDTFRTTNDTFRTSNDTFRANNDSFVSDASFHTTMEEPIPMLERRRSDARRVSVASSRASFAGTPMGNLRDTVLTSISVADSAVSDTMLSADTSLTTGTTPEEAVHEVGPLLYRIQPDDVLSFEVKPAPKFWGSTSFFVINASQSDCLVYKVRTSNQSGYVVKPSRGLVSTTNAQQVVVSLCAPRDPNTFDAAKREEKDGFLIEVANISREKYADLVQLDEHKRSREIGALWSLLPRSEKQSTMLSVELKMDEGDCSSGTRPSSGSVHSDARSKPGVEAPQPSPEELPRQSLASVVHGLKKLATSSTEDSPESAEDASDSDESAFTVAPTVLESEAGNSNQDAYGAASAAPRESAVIVVSADRMDTVDFSNPKLSFFI